MNKAISRAALLEWLNDQLKYEEVSPFEKGFAACCRNLTDRIERNQLDLIPTDIDVKEIKEAQEEIKAIFEAWDVRGICNDMENGYNSGTMKELSERAWFLANSNVLAKLSEYESHIGELDTAHQQMHARNERLEKELEDAKAEVERLRGGLEDMFQNREKWRDGHGLLTFELNQAVEALDEGKAEVEMLKQMNRTPLQNLGRNLEIINSIKGEPS